MPKFSVDYSNLNNKIYKKAYRLNDVKHLLETVAFDVVRFKDSDKGAELWQVQSADDGDYIVSLYENEDVKEAIAWEVLVNKTASTIQISYKGDPIVNLASQKLGIPKNELDKVSDYLPRKLAENSKLVKALLSELSLPSKKEVLTKYPELA